MGPTRAGRLWPKKRDGRGKSFVPCCCFKSHLVWLLALLGWGSRRGPKRQPEGKKAGEYNTGRSRGLQPCYNYFYFIVF